MIELGFILWVILSRLPEKGRREIVEEKKERDSGERKTRGPWWPCNTHLSNVALWEPDLELIKANILIKVQNDYINK